MRKSNNHGITLIALVLTIVIIIILAAISISFIISSNGIVNNSIFSREKHEEEKEKEIITLESASVIIDNTVNGKEAKMFRDEDNRGRLEKYIKNNGYDIEVDLLSEEDNAEFIFKVKFNTNRRVYIVKEDGTSIKIGDNSNNESSKDGILPYDENLGMYLVYKIEDLVELSNKINSNEEDDVCVMAKLMNDLDFNDPNSYYDKDRKDFGDLNEDGVLKSLIGELTDRTNAPNEGFIPIGYDLKQIDNYLGTLKMYEFDGNDKRIDNLYIKTNKYNYVGLFGGITNCNNLTVSGEVNVHDRDNVCVGGVAGSAYMISYINNLVDINAINVNSSKISGVYGDSEEVEHLALNNITNNSVINVDGNDNYVSGLFNKEDYLDSYNVNQLENKGEIHIKGNNNYCGGVSSYIESHRWK